MKRIFFLLVLMITSRALPQFESEETELEIGYLPETQKIETLKPSTTERQALALLLQAAKKPAEKEPEMLPVFQDPVIV